MKKLSLSLTAALFLLVSCETTYNTTSQHAAYDVPAVVQTSFTTQYPTAAIISWGDPEMVPVVVEREFVGWPAMGTEYVARFSMDGTEYYAWYDDTGNWIGTATVVTDHNSLPAAVSDLIRKDFGGYSITSVNREFRGEQIAYEIEMKSNTQKAKLLVDQNGTVLKKKIKSKD